MTTHTFRRTSSGPLTAAERGAIRGAVRGIWGAKGPHRPCALILSGVSLNDVSDLLPEVRHDPALQEACVRADARGPALVLAPRADLAAEWSDRVQFAPVVPVDARRTVERARDRGRSLPAKAAAVSESGPKWRKVQQ